MALFIPRNRNDDGNPLAGSIIGVALEVVLLTILAVLARIGGCHFGH